MRGWRKKIFSLLMLVGLAVLFVGWGSGENLKVIGIKEGKYTNDGYQITAVVKNESTKEYSNTGLQLWIGGETYFQKINYLRANSTVEVPIQTNLGQRGNYRTSVLVDCWAQIRESRETDNKLTQTVSLQDRPNLKITAVEVGQKNLTTGTYQLKVVVKNESKRSYKNLGLQLWVGGKEYSKRINYLEPKSTAVIPINTEVQQTGDYQAAALVDCWGEVKEISERDNKLTQTVEINNKPNLKVVDIAGRGFAEEKQGFEVTAVIKNESSKPYTNFGVQLWINGSTCFQKVDRVGPQSIVEVPIKTNLSQWGEYRATVLTDCWANFAESSEADNKLTETIELTKENVSGIRVTYQRPPAELEKAKEDIDRYAECGVTDLFVETFFNGMTIYPSRYATQHSQYSDQYFKQLINYAHQQGIRVHSWLEALFWYYPKQFDNPPKNHIIAGQDKLNYQDREYKINKDLVTAVYMKSPAGLPLGCKCNNKVG